VMEEPELAASAAEAAGVAAESEEK